MSPLSRRGFLQFSVAAAVVSTAACSSDEPEISPDARFPPGSFGASATAEAVTEGVNLSGKTALVTGCNSGLGYETLAVLAGRGVHVIGTGRTLEKAQQACASVGGKTTPLALELADFQSAVDCADAVKGMGVQLDMVIANAGINAFGELILVDGIERTFRVNHLGHFVLVNHLLPLMNPQGGRIVHVGSRSAYKQAPPAGIVFDSLNGDVVLESGEYYGQSKLANALFSLQLSKQLAGSGVTSNVIHPGLVQTNIARNAPAVIRKGFEWVGPLIAKTPAEGAATQVYVAANPEVAGVNGAYFEDCNPVTVNGPNHVFDQPMAQKLWQVSTQMTNGYV